MTLASCGSGCSMMEPADDQRHGPRWAAEVEGDCSCSARRRDPSAAGRKSKSRGFAPQARLQPWSPYMRQKPSSGWPEAAAAMCAAGALQFRLHDYHGGLDDLRAGVLRAPYPAAARCARRSTRSTSSLTARRPRRSAWSSTTTSPRPSPLGPRAQSSAFAAPGAAGSRLGATAPPVRRARGTGIWPERTPCEEIEGYRILAGAYRL